jgi:hypothetical protein
MKSYPIPVTMTVIQKTKIKNTGEDLGKKTI